LKRVSPVIPFSVRRKSAFHNPQKSLPASAGGLCAFQKFIVLPDGWQLVSYNTRSAEQDTKARIQELNRESYKTTNPLAQLAIKKELNELTRTQKKLR